MPWTIMFSHSHFLSGWISLFGYILSGWGLCPMPPQKNNEDHRSLSRCGYFLWFSHMNLSPSETIKLLGNSIGGSSAPHYFFSPEYQHATITLFTAPSIHQTAKATFSSPHVACQLGGFGCAISTMPWEWAPGRVGVKPRKRVYKASSCQKNVQNCGLMGACEVKSWLWCQKNNIYFSFQGVNRPNFASLSSSVVLDNLLFFLDLICLLGISSPSAAERSEAYCLTSLIITVIIIDDNRSWLINLISGSWFLSPKRDPIVGVTWVGGRF